jgi:oligosaccharide repeat unit polymerase
MQYLIIIFAIVNMVPVGVKYGKSGAPILFIQFWWFAWLYVSTQSFTGIYVPSDSTYWLFILMLSSVTSGVLMCRSKSSFSGDRISERKIKNIESWLYKLSKYIALPIVSLLFIKSILFLINIKNFNNYRADTFGLDGENILFVNSYLFLLYNIIFKSFYLVGLFIGAIYYMRYNAYRVLVMSSILITLDSVMTMGRFGMYYIIFTYVMILILRYAMDELSIKKLFINKLNLLIICVFGALFLVSTLRGGDDIAQLFNLFAINYHTMSFTIVDLELHNPASIIHDTTYGMSTLGMIERIIIMIITKSGINISSQASMVGVYLSDTMLLGQTIDGSPITGNAFGSVLFNLYRDGGAIFIVMSSMVYGYYMAKISVMVKKRSFYHMTLLLAFCYIGFFGIFQPILSGSIQITIISIYFIFKSNRALLFRCHE